MLAVWNRTSLRIKIPALILGFAVIVAVGVGIDAQLTASSTVHELTSARLKARAQTEKKALGSYFDGIREELILIASNGFTIDALKAFGSAYSELPDATASLKQRYIEQNPNPIGQKHLLDAATAGDAYDTAHGRYHPWFRDFLTELGYYDIFLFDRDGNLVYTVFKENDYATNFAANGGEWADSDLGRAFRTAISAQPRAIRFFDFSPYAPSADAPASFIATPVVENGQTIGVLAFQMPIDRINAIMNTEAGLGQTGEMVLVGSDGVMRNNSRFTEQNDILTAELPENIVRQALGGELVEFEAPQYRPLPLAAIGVPFEFGGANFSILAMQGVGEIQAPVEEMGWTILLMSLVLLAIASIIGIYFGRSISRPIMSVNSAMRRLAEGDTEVALPTGGRKDEIGEMIDTLSVFRHNAIERRRLEDEAKQALDHATERHSAMQALVGRFRSNIATMISAFSQETDRMQSVAEKLTQTSEAATRSAESAKGASDEASASVNTVASAAVELSVTIRDIADQSAQTGRIVEDANRLASETDSKVTSLSDAASKISDAISLISDIAAQTNLLALNATIEAARAGEAGKGFAVVASEVKALAVEAAKATDEIGRLIRSVQESTDGAVQSLAAITETLGQVGNFTTGVSTSVEEQHSATAEIANSIKVASDGTNLASESVTSVTHQISEAAAESQNVTVASESIKATADQLSESIDAFLKEVARQDDDRMAG